MASEHAVELLVAGIAAASALLGTGAGALLQGAQAKRQRTWAVEDRDKQQAHDVEIRRSEAMENRLHWLRVERRELYGRVLGCVDEYVAALRDLRDTRLPEVRVSSVSDVEQAHPIAARALRSMEQQNQLQGELVLIADREVREAASALQRALRQAFKAAVKGEDELAAIAPLRELTLGAMRRELIGVSPTAS